MTDQNYTVSRYVAGEESALWKLYFDTTHIVIGRDYTPAQCQRWAPVDNNMEEWSLRIRARNPFVVRADGEILGFAELEDTGHIDHFYVNYRSQRKGVGRALYTALETEALRLQIALLYTESSVTAMPFFVSMGFKVVEEQEPIICGSAAKRFVMTKQLQVERPTSG